MEGEDITKLMTFLGLREIANKKVEDESTLEDQIQRLKKADELDGNLMGELLSSLDTARAVFRKMNVDTKDINIILPSESVRELAERASDYRAQGLSAIFRIAIISVVNIRKRADELKEMFPNLTPDNDYLLWAVIEEIYKQPGAEHQEKINKLSNTFGIPAIEIDSFVTILGLKSSE